LGTKKLPISCKNADEIIVNYFEHALGINIVDIDIAKYKVWSILYGNKDN
jgi:hypothetical protein